MSYQSIRTLVPVRYTKTIKGEYKEFRGFTYIISFLKTAYGINVYTGSNIQDKMLSKLNSLINEYNNDYTTKKWITKDILNVCNPDNKDFKCIPKVIFRIEDIPLLDGTLRVKNKLKVSCNDKCGPDCKDNCFFVPKLTENPKDSKYFSNTINTCSCIPCFEYITQDGDIKCFQKDIVPNILETLLENFKKIYAASNDSNPRTAYYIFVDTFNNETEDVDDDIRKMVVDLQTFITKCKNPLSPDVQKECESMNRSKNQADTSCSNSKKIFCKNIDPSKPDGDKENCIKKDHNFVDVIRDNINYYLKPTISDSCYCTSINPIDGSEISDEQKWMKRNKCSQLNDTSPNFHVCSDNSYSFEVLNHLKDIRNNCDSSNQTDLCKDNTADSKNYDSYTFDFSYNGVTNINNCNTDDNGCLVYKNDTGKDSNSYNDKIDTVKENSIYKHSVKDYCYCHQPLDPKKECNTFNACFVEGNELDKTETCSKVHKDIFGDDTNPGKLTGGMSEEDKLLARNNIIDRNICENKLRCLGYVCNNGGKDNPYGSKYENDSSYSSYIRSFFKPITPSYTGLSLNYNFWDQITTPSNSNDQKLDISLKPVINAITGSPDTLTTYVKKKTCDTGNVINQYANIDARMEQIEENEMEKEKESMSQIFDISNYVGCAEGELSNAGKWLGNSIENAVTFGSAKTESLKTPKGCSNLGEGYSNFLSNIRSYTSNLIDSEENLIVSEVLGAVGNSLSKQCPKDKDNIPFKFDYSNLMGYFILMVFSILSIIAISMGGLVIIPILGLILIIFWIYDKVFSTKNDIDSVTNSTSYDMKYVIGITIIIISLFLLKRTKYGRRLNKRGFSIINENISQ